jgi:archaellin
MHNFVELANRFPVTLVYSEKTPNQIRLQPTEKIQKNQYRLTATFWINESFCMNITLEQNIFVLIPGQNAIGKIKTTQISLDDPLYDEALAYAKHVYETQKNEVLRKYLNQTQEKFSNLTKSKADLQNALEHVNYELKITQDKLQHFNKNYSTMIKAETLQKEISQKQQELQYLLKELVLPF